MSSFKNSSSQSVGPIMDPRLVFIQTLRNQAVAQGYHFYYDPEFMDPLIFGVDGKVCSSSSGGGIEAKQPHSRSQARLKRVSRACRLSTLHV